MTFKSAVASRSASLWLVLRRFFRDRVFRYRFIGGRRLLLLLTDFRRVNIKGIHGQGKTAGAILMAYYLKESGFIKDIIAPIPVRGQRLDWQNARTNFVMILDEAHLAFHSRHFAKNSVLTVAMADLRRRNCVVISPAVESIDKLMRQLMIDAFFKFGNVLWMYRCYQANDITGDVRVLGTFGILFPSWVFNLYSRDYSVTRYGLDQMVDLLCNVEEIKGRNDEVLASDDWRYFSGMDLTYE